MRAGKSIRPRREQVTLDGALLEWLASGHFDHGVSSPLQRDDIDMADSIHMLGSGVVARQRSQPAAGPLPPLGIALAEPWRLPSTRLIGGFDTMDYHDCGRVPTIGLYLFVNDLDFTV